MNIIQFISFLFAIGIIFFSIKRWIARPQKKLLRIPILLLMTHVIVFYGFVFFDNHMTNFADWSAILRLHSLGTYMLLELYGYWRDKAWMPQ